MAEVDARTIDYVEAHGTGTELGDQIEIAGLTRAFRHDTRDVAYCRIGSLKMNIGHLDAAAGAAGVIKTIMAMRAGEIPKLNFRELNPQLALETSPFLVSDDLHVWAASWLAPEGRRQLVRLGGQQRPPHLEEWPQAESDGGLGCVLEVLLLSARTAEALERSCALSESSSSSVQSCHSPMWHTRCGLVDAGCLSVELWWLGAPSQPPRLSGSSCRSVPHRSDRPWTPAWHSCCSAAAASTSTWRAASMTKTGHSAIHWTSVRRSWRPIRERTSVR